MLDVFVHTADAAPTSTAAAFPTRNYTIAPADAWSQRLEVQGFAAPVWVDADGNGKGTVTAVVSSTVDEHDHDRAARGAVRHADVGLVVRRRADRPGRLQPRPGARVHGDAGDFAFGVCAARRYVADLRRRSRAPCRRRWT